jgi:hypothetical protein
MSATGIGTYYQIGMVSTLGAIHKQISNLKKEEWGKKLYRYRYSITGRQKEMENKSLKKSRKREGERNSKLMKQCY